MSFLENLQAFAKCFPVRYLNLLDSYVKEHLGAAASVYTNKTRQSPVFMQEIWNEFSVVRFNYMIRNKVRF